MAAVLKAALKASEARTLLLRKISRRGNILRVEGVRYDLARVRSIYVVGAGKASAAMAQALEQILRKRITDGLVVVKYGHSAPVSRIKIVEAAHPVPDEAGREGARRLLSLVSRAGEGDLVIVLLSGGGSALLPHPAEGIGLSEKRAVTQMLLKSGADIREVNAVRKHLSGIKGGQLARAAAPARVLTLILSDVLGNALDAIASGPTAPDPTTFHDAAEALRKYRLWEKLPAGVKRRLELGLRADVPETPKPRDPTFRRVRHVVLGDNRLALRAAAEAAKRLGMRVQVLTGFLKGEAREVAQVFAALAREAHWQRREASPTCFLASGETTVTVQGGGLGGRCQEFALAGALEISGLRRTVMAAFGTDGTDGPTDVAGAYADDRTVQRAKSQGLDPLQALQDNASYPFFSALHQHLWTGPTRTNVNDLYLVIAL